MEEKGKKFDEDDFLRRLSLEADTSQDNAFMLNRQKTVVKELVRRKPADYLKTYNYKNIKKETLPL